MQVLPLGQGFGETETLNKVITFYQKLCPVSFNGSVFLWVIATRDNDHGLYSCRRCRKGNALAMVTPRCTNHALWHRCRR